MTEFLLIRLHDLIGWSLDLLNRFEIPPPHVAGLASTAGLAA